MVDNIKLHIGANRQVAIDCPCCFERHLFYELGDHLKACHQVTHIACPGDLCKKSPRKDQEIPTHKFMTHIRDYHFDIQCPVCKAASIGPFDIMDHLESNHQPKEDETTKSITYEIWQNGSLILLDGIHFFVKNKVAFMDCPLCVCKSMAMHLLPRHLQENHFIQ